MLRSELIKRIVEAKPGLRLRDGERAASAVLGTIAIALERGDRVKLREFVCSA
jgi:nucleoid DNA-binding protein